MGIDDVKFMVIYLFPSRRIRCLLELWMKWNYCSFSLQLFLFLFFQPFHRRITRRPRGYIPFKILIKGLATYIISNLPRHLSANNHSRIISYDTFGNRLKTPFLRMAHKSYFPNRRSSKLKVNCRSKIIIFSDIWPFTGIKNS